MADYPVFLVPTERDVDALLWDINTTPREALFANGSVPVGQDEDGKLLFVWEVTICEDICYRVIAKDDLSAEVTLFEAISAEGTEVTIPHSWVTYPAEMRRHSNLDPYKDVED